MSDLEGEGGAEPSPPMRMGCRKDTVSLIANSAEFVSIIQTTRVAVPIEKKETEFDRWIMWTEFWIGKKESRITRRGKNPFFSRGRR